MPNKKSRKNYANQQSGPLTGLSKFFTKTRIVVASGLVALLLASGSDTVQSPVQYENLFDKVQSNNLLHEEYFDLMIQRSPSLSTAIEEGVIAGVLYDPSVPELTDKLRGLITGKIAEDKIDDVISTQLAAYRIVDGKIQDSTFIPTLPEFYGIEIPSYILLPKNFLQVGNPSSDDEVISILEHEKDHVYDRFKPIVYSNGVTLTQEDLLSGKVGQQFQLALTEIRAYYEQFEGNLRTYLGIESNGIGMNHIEASAINYTNWFFHFSSVAKTPKEIEIKNAQMKEIEGIIPISSGGDGIQFQYRLNGRAEIIRIPLTNN